MDLAFFKMAFLGLIIAAPIGPVSVLCIQRILNHGFMTGVVCGIGIAAADAVFGALAVFSVTEFTNLLINNKSTIAIVGGAYLVFIGIKPLFIKNTEGSVVKKDLKKSNDFLVFFGITLTNPMTILTFAAAYSSIMLSVSQIQHSNTLTNIYSVLGIFIGSLLWWVLLSCVISVLHKKMTTNVMTLVNKVCGLVLLIYGVLTIMQAGNQT